MSSKDGPAVKIHPGPDALSRLYHVVAHNALMLQDLFKSWDTNNDGRVSKIEFAKGLSSLNWDAPKETVEALFNHMDKDKSGYLDYKELQKTIEAILCVVASVVLCGFSLLC